MGTVFTCSIDDGHPSDMKMAALLDKHGLQGTFYIPIHNREGFDVMPAQRIRELASRFEIGSHTYDHCFLKYIDLTDSHYQVTEGKKQLEDILGRTVEGFCYPGGKYRPADVQIVKAAGFRYARTTMNLCFDIGRQSHEMPTTCQFYPHQRNVYFRNFASGGSWRLRRQGLRVAVSHENWTDRLYALFNHACLHGRVFHLWGHSRDIDQLDAWEDLDHFLEYVASRIPKQDRLTNGELAERYF
jgi:peptidoglycan/xylan/chitin deacetylase (PgdA/CDA1 family)